MQLMARRRALWVSLALALALAACDDSGSGGHVEKAQEHVRSGDLPSAIIELKNALQEDPQNADARALLGEVYFHGGDPVSAIKELTRARELGRNDDPLRLVLAEARLQTSEYQAILDDIAPDQAMADDTGAGLVAARGQALFGLGRHDEAAEVLEKVASTRPVPAAYTGLARLALFRNDTEAAGRYLGDGLGKFPDNISLKLLQGEQQIRSRQFDAATATFDALAKADPDSRAAAMGLARAELARGRIEPARVVLDDLLEKSPQNLAARLLRSVAALQARDYAAAQQDADAVRAVDDRNAAALYVSGAASYRLEQYEQALTALRRYTAMVPNDPAARKLLAATQVRMGDPEAARETLGNDLAAADPETLALMSSASALSGDTASGLQLLEKAVVQSPEDAAMRARLGLIRIATGQTDEGITDLEKAMELDPQLDLQQHLDRAELMSIQTMIGQKQFDQAIAAAQRFQETHPDNATVLVLTGIAYLGKAQPEEARAAFEKALQLDPGAPDATANLAGMEALGGNLDAAQALLEKSLEHYPGNLRTLTMLAQYAAREGDQPGTIKWLEQAVETNPDALAPRVYLSRLYLFSHDPERALDVVQPALAEEPENPTLLKLAGSAQLAAKRNDDAVATLSKLVAASPGDFEARTLLAGAYEQTGDMANAMKQVDAALQIDPNNARAKIVLARLSLATDPARAKTLTEELSKAYPDSPEVIELQAELALRENDPKRAATLLQQARLKADSSRLAGLQAKAQWLAGEREASLATLEEWLNRNPQDSGNRLALAHSYFALGRHDDATKALLKIVEDHPDNWVARNEVAYLLFKSGDADTALGHAERAYELAPQQPVVMDTLGVILLSRGDKDRALPLIRTAADRMPESPDVAYHLASALAETGQKEEARSLLEQTLAKFPQFAERADAEGLLRRLGG